MKVYEVIPGKLYQRGYFATLKSKFTRLEELGVDIVVNTYYKTDPDMADVLYMYINIPVPDGVEGLQRIDDMHLVADMVAYSLLDGHSAIVHCYGGRNRSGLVNALIVRRYYGVTGAEALKIVREAREDSLSTQTFVDYLLSLDKPGEEIGT